MKIQSKLNWENKLPFNQSKAMYRVTEPINAVNRAKKRIRIRYINKRYQNIPV
jgi:hypothetical protein